MKNKFIILLMLVLFAFMAATAFASLSATAQDHSGVIAANTDGQMYFSPAKGPPLSSVTVTSECSMTASMHTLTIAMPINGEDSGADVQIVFLNYIIRYSESHNDLSPAYAHYSAILTPV